MQTCDGLLVRIALTPWQASQQSVGASRQANQIEAAVRARPKNRCATLQSLARLFEDSERETRQVTADNDCRIGALERTAQRAFHPITQIAIALQPDFRFDRLEGWIVFSYHKD